MGWKVFFAKLQIKMYTTVDMQTIFKGFDKLQTEIVTLRKEFVKAVDESRMEFENRLDIMSPKKEP